MDKNSKKKDAPSIHTLRGWIDICVGLIIILFSLIGATGRGPIGAFITYCFAFVFGMFYPFALVFLFFFGLHFCITRRFFSWKGNSMYWVGGILTIVSLLSFASYGIYTIKENGVDLTSINSIYRDKMLSFAHSPWQIDSYESLSGLAGGYLGLFFVSLLGTIWGKIGDAIFFSLLLVVGLFFFCFNPARFCISFFKEKKAKKVSYQSPYQPNKEKTNPHLNRSSFKEKEQEKTTPSYQFSQEAKAPLDNSWNTTSQGGFSSPSKKEYSTFEETTYEDNISNEEQHQDEPLDFGGFTSFKSSETPKKQEAEQSDFTSTRPIKEQNVTPEKIEVPPTPVFDDEIPFEKEEKQAVPQKEENPAFVPVPPVAPSNFESDNSSAKQPKKTNPLDDVVSSSPLKSSSSAEYQVKSEKGEEPKTDDVVETPVEEDKEENPSEEDLEKKKEQEYFSMKQQKKAQALIAKKKEKEQRIESLMKYVSDVPKDYNYNLPNDSLLEEIDDSAKMEQNSNSAQEKASIINRVLDEFQVKAKTTSFTIGASVTRFNVETEHGEKADKIANLTKEIQIALNGDMSVRVETVVEGRSTSGIEVGNIAPMAVSFKDMFMSIEQDHKNPLLLPIGKDISGNVITFPLNKMPHMLVAGTTGSGKSVLIHSMIMTLIMRTYPSQCKLMLIDPKQVEFIRYQDCSHLFCPVISKPESAILALKKLCDEMDRRFTVLSKCRVANLEAYNELKAGRESQYEDMPYIVTVIDEFADLMQTGGNEVTKYVTRIAQKARACGIHLIIATQRPSKDNVPMIIKANVPCRIGLSCSSQIDSRVILDENGAETLLGKGDLLFKCPGRKTLIRAQSPFISDKDINAVLEYVKRNAGDPNYDPDFLDLEVEKPSEEEDDPEGDLYSDIKDYVIHTGITSKASIMRCFQVSSMKADQFMARLQSESIIALGPSGKYVLGPAAHLEDFE